MTKHERIDLYQDVTNRIVEQLENGVAPWVQPWSSTASGPSLPLNVTTGRRYSGINVLLLWGTVQMCGFTSQRWLTFNQARKVGGSVRKGEKGTTVFYADSFVPGGKEAEEDARAVQFLKRYTVFNIDQCEHLPEDMTGTVASLPERETVPHAEALLQATGADIRIGGDKAFYAPDPDYIRLPPQNAYFEQINWYRTAFHETAHWSGHKSRLDRDLSGRFGSHKYMAEEIVAELTAAFVLAELNITPTVRHADYIGSWISLLKEDKRAVFTAARLASQAAEYILAFQSNDSCLAAPFSRMVA
ncbi:DNA primase TraC [Acetobacter pasteurianus]|uniref:DNA primase TraC n=1 Tax=Acetobacter pasteurianus TaxID=438 RepID=A0A1A0CUB2_ACEPA|nr:zincin-like metallopeptidase domain-containing protein [Acetobacter pasteurianus]OAZ65942.1 DNA primase TraC [Acetobacter pasteurianus]